MTHQNSAWAFAPRRSATLAASLLVLLLALFAGSAAATSETIGDTFAASITAGGAFADSGVGQALSISDDGRYVAFTSAAENLSAEAPTGLTEAYVKDLQTDEVKLVSRAGGDSGEAADEPRPAGGFGVERPLLSGDGRYVIFDTPADNLVAGIPSGGEFLRHVYRRDLQTGTTALVDQTAGGTIVSDEARVDAISDNGRYVLFSARVEDLDDPAGSHGEGNTTLYLRDLAAGTTTAVGRAGDTGGEPGDLAGTGSEEGEISHDGRYVLFISYAANLDPEANGFYQVYRRDLQTGETALVSRSNPTASAPIGEPDAGESWEPAFVGDSNCRVAFTGVESANLTTGVPPTYGTYLRDLCVEPPTTTLVSLDESGEPFEEATFAGAGSDGHRVLVEGTTFPGPRHLYLRDLGSGETTLIDRAAGTGGEPGDSEVEWAGMSGNGCRAAFTSASTNLTAQAPPSGSSNLLQAYVRQLGACEPPTAGDGGKGAGPGGDRHGAGPGAASNPTRLAIRGLDNATLRLGFSGAGTARVRIRRLVAQPRRHWPLVREIVATATKAGELAVSLPALRPGRYRLNIWLEGGHGRGMVRFFNTLPGTRIRDGGTT